jgi:hypothetical protein
MWAGSKLTPEAYAIPGVGEVVAAGYGFGGFLSVGGALVQGIAGFEIYEQTGDSAPFLNSFVGIVLDRFGFSPDFVPFSGDVVNGALEHAEHEHGPPQCPPQ